MENLFYITQPQEGFYNLRIAPSHLCIATGRDLDVILEKVEKYSRVYKTAEIFLFEYNEIIQGFNPNEESIAHYEKMKNEHMLKGDPSLAELIKEAIERGHKKSSDILTRKLVKKVEEVQEEPVKKQGLIRPKRKKIESKVVEEPVKKSGLVRPKRKAVK